MAKPAIFLDRDGTINVDSGYVRDPQTVQLIAGAAKAIGNWNRAGLPVMVISNQSGVARGIMSLAQVVAVNYAIQQLLSKQGAHIDAFYFCPHYPKGKIALFSKVCDCRKPGTALINKGVRQHHLDATQSIFVGDKPSDIAAGTAAGMKTVLVRSGQGAKQWENWPQDHPQPDTVEDDLLAAWQWWENINR